MNKDYYKVLEIDKSASEEEIKKSYRRLAHKYHPDKDGGDEKKFKEINEAYQVLSDKEKRAQYDGFGSSPFGARGEGFGGWDFSGFPGGFGFDPSNLEDLSGIGDIFDAFFEGLGVKRRKTYERGADIEAVKEISLEEAFRGSAMDVAVETFVECKECGGFGHFPKEGFVKCGACGGKGEIRENRQTFFGQFSQVRACNKCRGQGEIPNKICKGCSGAGRLKSRRDIQVNIAAGIADGQLIKVSAAGQAGERGAGAGDLYIRVRIKPHPVFKRLGNDLVVKKDIDILRVLKGEKIEIPTLRGGKIMIEIPAGFNLREQLRIPGEGMPGFGGRKRGDLYVEFDVKVPKISSKLKKALEDSE